MPCNRYLQNELKELIVKELSKGTSTLNCFTRDCVGPFIEIKGRMNAEMYKDILESHMLPHAKDKMATDWVFQHDNDPKHSSKLVSNWLKENNVKILQWPAQSPDLNPIEHLWEAVERQIRLETFQKTSDLMKGISCAWNELSVDVLSNLVESMPLRCEAVIKAKGYATKY